MVSAVRRSEGGRLHETQLLLLAHEAHAERGEARSLPLCLRAAARAKAELAELERAAKVVWAVAGEQQQAMANLSFSAEVP